ncbi:MAG TPA: MurT ligase domain-containing protein [Ktedonobacteraceae bacterium]
MGKQKSARNISIRRNERLRRQPSRTEEKQSADDHKAFDGHRYAKRRRTSFRAGLAVLGGRAAGALSRRLHLGGGTSIAGVVAQRLYPDIVGHLSTQLRHGSVMVTGTNGKTTTSGFVAAILNDAGLRVWRNREGSNLMRGVAGALVIRARPNGSLRRSGQAISVFEVDEAVVPQFVESVPPRVAIFNNLFRDQLDRYGEVDSVAVRWQQAIRALPDSTTLVLNADDPGVASLGEDFTGQVVHYGIDDPALDLSGSSARYQAMDSRTCPRCGADYIYTMRFFSHTGHYFCPQCGYTRPVPQVRAVKVQNDGFDRLRVEVETPEQRGEVVIPLPGLYNVYNALAAIATAQALQVAWNPIVSGIEQFKPVFGRGERVQIDGRTVRLLLAKNPTGFNEVLRTLFSDDASHKQNVLFILNDNIADGRDISWIWDVDFERVVGHTNTLTISGTRALDMTLRLKYAGVRQEDMITVLPAPLRAAIRSLDVKERRSLRRRRSAKSAEAQSIALNEKGAVSLAPGSPPDTVPARNTTTFGGGEAGRKEYGIAKALDAAINRTPAGETLFVVPTYTGLLEVHRELERRGLTPHYWEEKGP